MPFTLAHPAAVLPLMRRPLNGLALVCGAMAPDIPYFIRATPLQVTAQSWYEPFTNATTSHSLAGLLPVTLPLALVVYLMLLAATPPMLWLARGGGDPWALNAERPQRNGVASLWPARWAWVPVSLLIGVLTHLLWDSLTSSDGFAAEHLDALNETVLADLTWVRLMQHASTAIGLTVVVIAVWGRRRTFLGQDSASRRRASWALASLVMVGLIAGAVAVLATVDSSASSSTRDLVENVLATAMMSAVAAVAIAVALVSGCWWLVMLRTRQRRPAEMRS